MRVFTSPFHPSTDRRLRLLGPVLLFLVGALFFRLQLYVNTPSKKLPVLATVALTAGYAGWEMSRWTALYLQSRLPGLERIRQRLLFLVLSIVVIAHIGYLLRNTIHALIGSFPFEWPSLLDYSSALGVLIFYATVTLNIYEGAYLWTQWQQAAAEKERLVRSEWQAKFDVLRNQINPHFLFNSLNALSALISEDAEKAEAFTNELSKVYRYLLRSNDQELVTLSSELQFILSYSHLLKTRYGEGFQLSISVEPSYYPYLLPALTLQLLVENAVKHNVVSREQPLEVVIRIDEACLLVENPLQKKDIKVFSNGVGLANINDKLRLLGKEGITVAAGAEKFVVRVPLMKT